MAERAETAVAQLQRRVLLGAWLAVAGAFLWSMLAATGGHFAPQVADLYVVAQYARALAEGHPFAYQLGESLSTGATSLLHTALLALAWGLGLRGEGLIAGAIGLGALLHLGTILAAARLGGRLAGPRAALVAGLLVALGGPVAWGCFYGSDTAPALCLALLLFEQALRLQAGARPRGFALVGVLLALTRPEALVLVAALALAFALGPGRTRPARQRLVVAMPVLAGLLAALLFRLVSGSWGGSSVSDKSLFESYGLREGLALTSEYLIDVLRGLLLGFYPSQAPVGLARGWASLFFPPLGLALVLLAAVRARPPQRRALLAWLGACALTVAAVAPSVFMGVHYNRYLLWLLPGLLVLVAVGLEELAGLVGAGDAAAVRRAALLGAALLLVLGGLSTLRFAALYGQSAGLLYHRDGQMARFIRAKLPAGTRVASSATSVEYLSGHRNLNLHGVTSPAFFGNRTAEREAGTLESLGRLPLQERPAFLLASVSQLQSQLLLRELAAGPPLFETSSLSDDELQLVPLSWAPLERARDPHEPATLAAVAGLERVDGLNLCDRADERAHAYAVETQLAGQALNGGAWAEDVPAAGGRVLDAGRLVAGSERFRARLRPGRDLVLVLRTASLAPATLLAADSRRLLTLQVPEAELALRIDAAEAGGGRWRPRPGFDEWLLRVPGALVRARDAQLELRGHYAAFRYWFYQ